MKKLDMINKVNQNDDAFSGIIAFLIGFFVVATIIKALFWIGAILFGIIAGGLGYLIFF
jgi:hypothetical protein